MNNFLKKSWDKYTNDKGATTIMVVFMMIVLVTLGIFSLISSKINFDFSQKSKVWSEEFFITDSKGQEALSKLDTLFNNCEIQTINYINERGFAEKNYSNIDAKLQDELHNIWTTESDKNLALNKIANTAYQNFIMTGIEYNNGTRKISNQDMVTYESLNENNIVTDVNFVQIGIQSDKISNFYINILLGIQPFDYTLRFDGTTIKGDNLDNGRYYISEWNQWQPPQQVPEAEDLWDGSVSPQ